MKVAAILIVAAVCVSGCAMRQGPSGAMYFMADVGEMAELVGTAAPRETWWERVKANPWPAIAGGGALGIAGLIYHNNDGFQDDDDSRSRRGSASVPESIIINVDGTQNRVNVEYKNDYEAK